MLQMIKHNPFLLSIILSIGFFLGYILLCVLNDKLPSNVDFGWILSILWFVAPLVIAFITSSSTHKHKLILSCSLIILYPLIGTLINYLANLIGFNGDFYGLKGSLYFFKIIFLMVMPSIIIGIAWGLLSHNRDKNA